MAKSTQVSVGTTATPLTPVATQNVGGDTVILQNTGAAAVFLGGPDVTTANGYSLAAGASLSIVTDDNLTDLFGIVASGTVTVGVLRI